MAAHVRITPLSGIGRVGGSIFYVRQGRKGLIFDFGADFDRTAKLLGPRTRLRDNRGILDPLSLGLIPFYDGIYREDLLLDEDMLEEAEDIICTDLLLTHFHQDHCFNVPLLDPSIRVHLTLATAAMLNAQSIAGVGIASEGTHYVPRIPHPNEEGILQKPRGEVRTPRLMCTVDGVPSQEMREAWGGNGSDEGLRASDMIAAGLPFLAHPVDHSIFGTSAYELLTAQGSIVHASDLRRHGSLGHLTEELIEYLERDRKRMIILEGTRLSRSGDVRTTEAQALARIRNLVKKAGKCVVIASVGAGHLERLAAFLAAARESKRLLVVSARVMLTLQMVGAACPFLDLSSLDGLAVYDPPMGHRQSYHRDLRGRKGVRLVTLKEIRKDPHRFIVTHSMMRMTDWIDLKPQNALFIYSNSGAYSDQARMEHSALKLWAEMYQMNVVGIEFKNRRSIVDPFLCPSGHLHADDIKELIERARPEILLPCHCSEPELFKSIAPKGVRVILAENGRTIKL